jgi:hypothetical protein
MAIAAVMGGLQFGMGILGGFSKHNEAVRQAEQQHKSNVYQNTFQNLMIKRQNELTEQRFDKQLEIADRQFSFNAEAARRSMESEQVRLNEVFRGTAFQNSAARTQLMRAMGANRAAGGNRGRSFERASLVSTLGEFGRQQAIQAESLSSARAQSERNLQNIDRQLRSANNQTFSGIAIPPQLQTGVAAPTPPAAPRMNMGLMIGQAALSGLQTGYNFTASGEKFFGFEKP